MKDWLKFLRVQGWCDMFKYGLNGFGGGIGGERGKQRRCGAILSPSPPFDLMYITY